MPRKKPEIIRNLAPLRPMPPDLLFDESNWTKHFVPADGLAEWVAKTLMDESSPLYNEDHKHLHYADIEYLWAAVENKRQMRRVVGQCEEVTFRCGAWQKGRQEQQMKEWFGRVPAYLITLDAHYARECSDIEFCALVEHELFHIAQERDAFDAPAFTRDGLPKIGIQGHDCEEFVGIVRRYGVGAAAGKTAALVEAAKRAPEVGQVDIARMCGTCLLKAA
ncbi:putative metallopeptidase [Paraburkholderia gardini]|uniref:putative metallopeptidase n=1 Tax=Paraburkholderia gardini TaxID=2823469 RepID=UPI001D56F4F4|nr:putative metallopeptidase [Paraburkholderia gardini]CAG4889387.1 hypothetical protein R69919_00729 [Paraburkholderia gardini]